MNKISVYIESLIIFLFGIGILYIVYFQTNIADDLKSGLDSPILFPKLVAGLLMFLAVFQAVSHKLKHSNKKNIENNNEEVESPNNKALWAGILILFAFVLLIPVLGFLIASCLSMFVLVYVFKKVKWYKATTYSVVSAVVIWFAFEFLLNISLPTGFLGI